MCAGVNSYRQCQKYLILFPRNTYAKFFLGIKWKIVICYCLKKNTSIVFSYYLSYSCGFWILCVIYHCGYKVSSIRYLTYSPFLKLKEFFEFTKIRKFLGKVMNKNSVKFPKCIVETLIMRAAQDTHTYRSFARSIK